MSAVTYVDRSSAAHAALSPIRLEILRHLSEPASATELAEQLATTRQKVTYHLGILSRHGLVRKVDERRKRGFVEQVFQRSGDIVLAPDLVAETLSDRDALAADAVIAAASDAIRSVGALAPAAAARGASLATATLSTDITFRSPSELRAFLAAVGDLAARFDRPDAAGARTMRVTVLSHPTQEGPEP